MLYTSFDTTCSILCEEQLPCPVQKGHGNSPEQWIGVSCVLLIAKHSVYNCGLGGAFWIAIQANRVGGKMRE